MIFLGGISRSGAPTSYLQVGRIQSVEEVEIFLHGCGMMRGAWQVCPGTPTYEKGQRRKGSTLYVETPQEPTTQSQLAKEISVY